MRRVLFLAAGATLVLIGGCTTNYSDDLYRGSYNTGGPWTFVGYRNRSGDIPFNGAGYTYDGRVPSGGKAVESVRGNSRIASSNSLSDPMHAASVSNASRGRQTEIVAARR